jgi:hypothetical protein
MDEFELKVYDAKVYKATMDMDLGQSARLKSLGIPFFGVPTSLIGRSQPSGAWNITDKELLDQQVRMLKYLEEVTS